MIILPPEEKKSSPVAKWVFRILMISVVTGALLIFALNILSGTSDAHRRGLEQALSDIFRTNVTIGTLKEFNIFPVFQIEMENVQGSFGTADGEVRAGNVVLAFRFFDLLFGRDLVKDIQVQHLTITPGIIGTHGLKIMSAGIVPIKVQAGRPFFKLQGEYGGLPIAASLELEVVGGMQPVYRIKNDLPARVDIGKMSVSGKFVQNNLGEPSIQSANFLINDKSVATGSFTILTSKPTSEFKIDFVTPHSQGTLITHNEPKSQMWNFEKLDLSDVVAETPEWVQVSNAVTEFTHQVTTVKDISPSTLVTVDIKSLKGDVSAEGLKGVFVSAPDIFTGWWDGVITSGSIKNKEGEALGKIQCGLLSLTSKGDVWSTDTALVLTEPASVLAKLAVHSRTGEIDWSINRVAAGSPSTFNIDLTPFLALKKDLNFPVGHPCLPHIEKVSAP